MRIYHKKNFWAGLGMAALGILNLVLSLWRRLPTRICTWSVTYYPMDTPFAAWVAAGVLVALGIGEVILSRSHRFSRWEEINKTDERNQLVRYRTYGAVLRWTRWGCLVLILLAGYSTALTGNDFLLNSVPGLIDALLLSWVIQFAAWLYYRAKT